MNFPNMPKDEKLARSQMAVMTSKMDQIHAELDKGIQKQSSNDINTLSTNILALSQDPGLLRNMDPETRRDMLILAFTYADLTLSDSLNRIARAKMEENFLFSDEIFDPEEDK